MTPRKVNTADALIQAALRGELTEAQARQLYDHGREVVAFAFAAATRLIVWQALQRPSYVVTSEDDRSVGLFSAANKELHRWAFEPPGVIRSARLVERPAEFGDERMVLLALARTRAGGYPSGLYAFDASTDPPQPVWHTHVDPATVPTARTSHDYNSEGFIPCILLIADLFPDPPGAEIVCQHHFGPYSQTVFRIYGMDGSVLYQFWHDGMSGPDGCYWLSGPGLLVFSALNAEAYPEDRGIQGLKGHPRVIFAVRPQLGQLGNSYLRTRPGVERDQAVWYQTLRPFESQDRLARIGLESPMGEIDLRNCVQLSFEVSAPGVESAGVWFVVDQHGREVPNSRGWTDGYERKLDRLPDPRTFKLDSLPPIVEQATATGAAAEP